LGTTKAQPFSLPTESLRQVLEITLVAKLTTTGALGVRLPLSIIVSPGDPKGELKLTGEAMTIFPYPDASFVAGISGQIASVLPGPPAIQQ
jgi:hypothetical protein